MNTNQKQHNKIILFIIDTIKNNIDKKLGLNLEKTFKNNEENILLKSIHRLMNIPKCNLLITSKYIDTNLNKSKSPTSAINELNKIITFFDTINYQPLPNFYDDILKNNEKIDYILQLIVDKYLPIIKNNKIDTIFENEILISLIENYCMIHNITIENTEEDLLEDLINQNITMADLDIIKLYFKEIRKYPILTKEEETELALKIAAGDNEAKKIFIERNLKLVVSVAKKYIGNGLEFEDLIQEGNMGLMKALDKFDVTKGYKFSTYATTWIRQSITRAIANYGRTIRLPVYLVDSINKYQKEKLLLEQKLGKELTNEELAKELHLPLKKINNMEILNQSLISTNVLIGKKKDTEIEELIPNDEYSLEENIIFSDMTSNIMDKLQKCNLTQRERQILILRFGLEDGKRRTLKEIGQIFNISHERIRQNESDALKKLRNPKYARNLADYMPNPNKSLKKLGISPN